MIKNSVAEGALAGKKIAFIGAGFMGEAIIRGILKAGAASPTVITAHDPAPKALESLASLKVTLADSATAAVDEADIVVFAIKPQVMEKVASSLKKGISKNTLVISIAAGVSTTSLESWLDQGAKVVRAMPNMAASVGQSATAICAGKAAGEGDMAVAQAMFEAVGGSVTVDESLMDAVTGLSGSGPAYVFMFLEGLIDAGVSCGLPRDAATYLARQTLYGSALLAKESGEHPSILKERITSPGGTTIAALSALEGDGYRGSIIKAVRAAMERSRELGKK
ncbi:MAG: pyrroline-5-carboxylate reductase [Nitrospinota bacterium]|nr:pyrroline-5-carboxylate reductase [Nitrospinota bacterium]